MAFGNRPLQENWSSRYIGSRNLMIGDLLVNEIRNEQVDRIKHLAR
jgi:hypothetical protein